MKTIILISVFIFISVILSAQNCFWAKKMAGSSDDFGTGVVTTANSIYSSGYFESDSIVFGDTVIYNQSATDNVHYDMFITKHDLQGNFLWAKSYPGLKNEAIKSLAADSDNNLYITGYFDGDTLNMDGIELINDYTPYPVCFIAKLDQDGNTIWAIRPTGHSYSLGHGIAADNSGNVFMTGEFQRDSIAFGNIVLHKIGTGGSNYLIVKLDPSGNPLWARNAGGRFADCGKNITTDDNGNAFVIGDFLSDSLTFGNNVIYNNATANGDFFIVKYDADGNALWAQNHSGGSLAYGYGITAKGNAVYVTGGYKYSPFVMGGISVNNYGSDMDVFTAKINTDGTVMWLKTAGGNKDDVSRNIATDSVGNIYVIGHYRSDSIFFNNIKLTNATQLSYTMSYLFIVKYDSLGNPVWARRAQGTFSELDDLAVSSEDNVYFTGSYYNDPATFGNVVLTNTNYEDIYLAQLYAFSPVISSATNVSCHGFNNGSVSVSQSGGIPPITYLWNTGNTNSGLTDLTAGNYSVTVSDAYSCSQVLAVSISQPPADSARICMVTVDSLSQHNIIVWDKTVFTTVDSFIVYREIFTGNYQPIARLPYNAISQFIDTVRTEYFPNTGNPNSGTFRYKIQVHDTCGGYSELSPYHNTIYLLNNGAGIFYWTTPYTIENGPNPVTSYVLMRDDHSNGNWQPVSSVAGSQQTVSDPLYAVYKDSASWRVQTNWNVSCVPTNKNVNVNYNSSYSNIYTNYNSGINTNLLDENITVYPNPTTGLITINSMGNIVTDVEVNDIIGKEVYSKFNKNTGQADISLLPDGIYFVNVICNKKNKVFKVVKNHE